MKKILLTVALLLTFGVSANAQIIGATNSQKTSNPKQSDNSPIYRPTGGSLRFSSGYPGLFTVSYNHYFTPGFMLGGGLGVGYPEYMTSYYRPGYYFRRDNYDGSYYIDWMNEYRDYFCDNEIAMPAFVEMELRTPKYKWSLFLNLKVGLNLFGEDDAVRRYLDDTDYYGNDVYKTETLDHKVFLFTAAVGISYKNINLGFGYGNQHKAYVPPITFFLSYKLPLTTINKWLF